MNGWTSSWPKEARDDKAEVLDDKVAALDDKAAALADKAKDKALVRVKEMETEGSDEAREQHQVCWDRKVMNSILATWKVSNHAIFPTPFPETCSSSKTANTMSTKAKSESGAVAPWKTWAKGAS